MKKPDILPGKREISYSHGHAHITRDGEPFVNLQLGREGWELHSEGVHFKLAPDARLIAAAPAMAEALFAMLEAYAPFHQESVNHKGGEDGLYSAVRAARQALFAAGYTEGGAA